MITKDAGSRIFGLDLLRAFAVLTVVYAHGAAIVAHRCPACGQMSLDGVTLFFVLSGYLIGGILIKEFQAPNPEFRALLTFWSRRWLRTLPAYFFVLALLILLSRVLTGKFPADPYYYYFFFSQNIASVHPNFFPEAWSLAVEEWFYLVIPFTLWLLLKATRKKLRQELPMVVIVTVVMITIVRIQQLSTGDIQTTDVWDDNLRKMVVTRLDSVMFGVLGAYLSVYHSTRWQAQKNRLFVIGVALLVIDKIMMENLIWRNYLTLSVTPMAALLLLPKLASLKPVPYSFLRLVTFVSLISYSLYLVHFSLVKHILLKLLTEHLPPAYVSTAMLYGSYWILSIGLAWLLYRWVELPFMKLRDVSVLSRRR